MQLIFVYVEMDDAEAGRPVAEYFGVEENAPKVLLLYLLLLQTDWSIYLWYPG